MKGAEMVVYHVWLRNSLGKRRLGLGKTFEMRQLGMKTLEGRLSKIPGRT